LEADEDLQRRERQVDETLSRPSEAMNPTES
jgi:hypothetical protein